jgi:hypothetical protein
VSTDSSNLSYKRFNDDKILNPPRINTLKRKPSLNKLSGSVRTLSREASTLKRTGSKLAKNKAHQSEMSLSRQTSLPAENSAAKAR